MRWLFTGVLLWLPLSAPAWAQTGSPDSGPPASKKIQAPKDEYIEVVATRAPVSESELGDAQYYLLPARTVDAEVVWRF